MLLALKFDYSAGIVVVVAVMRVQSNGSVWLNESQVAYQVCILSMRVDSCFQGWRLQLRSCFYTRCAAAAAA
jgi:hypothetical protein